MRQSKSMTKDLRQGVSEPLFVGRAWIRNYIIWIHHTLLNKGELSKILDGYGKGSVSLLNNIIITIDITTLIETIEKEAGKCFQRIPKHKDLIYHKYLAFLSSNKARKCISSHNIPDDGSIDPHQYGETIAPPQFEESVLLKFRQFGNGEWKRVLDADSSEATEQRRLQEKMKRRKFSEDLQFLASQQERGVYAKASIDDEMEVDGIHINSPPQRKLYIGGRFRESRRGTRIFLWMNSTCEGSNVSWHCPWSDTLQVDQAENCKNNTSSTERDPVEECESKMNLLALQSNSWDVERKVRYESSSSLLPKDSTTNVGWNPKFLRAEQGWDDDGDDLAWEKPQEVVHVVNTW